MKILLRIAFLGKAYCGYQVQPNGVSVQQKLNEAAKDLFGYDCDIVGCSRTDSGVHANEFYVAVSKKKEGFIETTIPIEKIPQAMSVRLPSDISVLSAIEVEDDFHPRYDVVYKEYVYQIWNGRARNPFLADRSWHCPKSIDDEALMRMQIAAKMFIGKKDFASFMAADSKIKDSVRTVIDASVMRQGDLIIFRVSADGFLYNMVRIFTGTLVDVAYGRISVNEIENIIAACDRKRAGATAPPEGLFLNKVIYK
ncbi:MAG: tRNA pseudouridine(38-40) synthase TruA [Ruminococcaceae bacterium]|nr:tRNA pseudouridine(38-40) synthase TruA [Oscillospiraceae bacterium]